MIKDFSELEGMTLSSVVENGNDEIIFKSTDGRRFKMHHYQGCCENVVIESIVGDLADLIDSPIILAEESVTVSGKYPESETYTFYKLATRKGYVDIRWVGSSNGYYSETVDFEEVE